MSTINLVLATHNDGKRREYDLMLKDLPVQIHPLWEFAEIPELPEVGTSFEQIAEAKAQHAAGMLGLSAIAEDSGLVVEALGGAPGIFSARYAGESADDAANNRKLLDAMRATDNRRASFVCVIAIAKPSGQTRIYTGRCTGKILHEPRGEKGFGYDPLFLYPPLGRTFAELPAEQKSEVSHRGRAIRRLRDDFQSIVTWMEDEIW
jgi:XTP/dITP diphosphohydrolase